jgi:hypothetical protein
VGQGSDEKHLDAACMTLSPEMGNLGTQIPLASYRSQEN